MLGDQLKDLVCQSMSKAPPEFYCLFAWDEMIWHRTSKSLIVPVIEVFQDKFPAHRLIWSNITPGYDLEG